MRVAELLKRDTPLPITQKDTPMGTVTRSNADMTYLKLRNAAYRAFVALGYAPRYALYNATYYAVHKTAKKVDPNAEVRARLLGKVQDA